MEARMLAHYFEGLDGAGLIPAADDDRRLLLDVYGVVKAMYEVRYELANRPAWTSWPLAAISEMFDLAATR
jgi:maltose alpha-D-glucosyltransferase/alpha-amylase